MSGIDTYDVNALTGAIFFTVGRGTEGGGESYKLSVPRKKGPWGDASLVIDDSGYSIGTIQVDLGQRGTWALGSTDDKDGTSRANHGEKTYVDAIIEQAASYAKEHGLPFTQDLSKLRADLLTHGHGQVVDKKGNKHTLTFIDEKTTYDSINKWASSPEGQQWIHKNIDYAQVKSVTQQALDVVNKYSKQIPEDHRLEAVALLAKSYNQSPYGAAKVLENVLKRGGNYDAMLHAANDYKYGHPPQQQNGRMTGSHPNYHGPEAVTMAEKYENAANDPKKAAALNRAHDKVRKPDFDPSTEGKDPDIQAALHAIGKGGRSKPVSHVGGHGGLGQGANGKSVTDMQKELQKLGYLARTDEHGNQLKLGHFGQKTVDAIKHFQKDNHLPSNGVADHATLKKLHDAESRQNLFGHDAKPVSTLGGGLGGDLSKVTTNGHDAKSASALGGVTDAGSPSDLLNRLSSKDPAERQAALLEFSASPPGLIMQEMIRESVEKMKIQSVPVEHDKSREDSEQGRSM